MFKVGLISGSIFSMLSVILGAFGAHYLKNTLSEYSLSIFQTGVFYQFIHSLGILFIALLSHSLDNINLNLSVWFFITGIFLFSGSLYLLALTDVKWLGAITPIGGMFFILGWFALIIKSFKI
ncbi:MAG: hypothetical protein CMG50_02460 [Candidatus Marinimicrobia bacterium]|nr:hypothetical protein [Candidatus Neomarinimicrobiota bacterium]|tara:strand:+ start:141 stop:509 length:369 start_codon:yes stop_codon:yes gene_type:complete